MAKVPSVRGVMTQDEDGNLVMDNRRETWLLLEIESSGGIGFVEEEDALIPVAENPVLVGESDASWRDLLSEYLPAVKTKAHARVYVSISQQDYAARKALGHEVYLGITVDDYEEIKPKLLGGEYAEFEGVPVEDVTSEFFSSEGEFEFSRSLFDMLCRGRQGFVHAPVAGKSEVSEPTLLWLQKRNENGDKVFYTSPKTFAGPAEARDWVKENGSRRSTYQVYKYQHTLRYDGSLVEEQDEQEQQTEEE